jgi:hypothetical protein
MTTQTSPQPALAGTGVVISGAARQVTLSMNYGMNANGRKPPAPWPPGTYSCPFADGMAFILTFRAHPGGLALATAVLDLNGCGGTGLTVGAKDYGLGDPESARPLATRLLEVTGVPWKLPPFLWPPS